MDLTSSSSFLISLPACQKQIKLSKIIPVLITSFHKNAPKPPRENSIPPANPKAAICKSVANLTHLSWLILFLYRKTDIRPKSDAAVRSEAKPRPTQAAGSFMAWRYTGLKKTPVFKITAIIRNKVCSLCIKINMLEQVLLNNKKKTNSSHFRLSQLFQPGPIP